MNYDTLKLFPNQNLEREYTECVALTIADITGNRVGAPFEPDYVYARTCELMNLPPNTNGLSPYEAMLATVAFGVLPASADTTSAMVNGELYVANYKLYNPYQTQLAAQYAAKGVIHFYTPQQIRDYLDKNKAGVLLALRWYNSFTSAPNGVLSTPQEDEPFTYHAVAVYDYDSTGLICKPWLGKEYGDGGYAHLPYSLFDTIYEDSYAFDPNGWRWLSLANICVTHIFAIADLYPVLKSSYGPH